MKPIKDVVEDLEERDLADITPLGRAQARPDVVFEVFFSYLGRYGAHHCSPS
jgi:hypothetical protein